jgi:subtilase family serine protease
MPTDLIGGDTATFTTTVENIGSGNTSRDFYVQFEVDGKYIGRKIVSGLDSGSSADVTQTWTATWADTVNVSVDEYDTVAESNETNNRVSKDLPGLPYPDLIVNHLTWEPKENVDAGDPVTFTATIENTGGTFYSTLSNPLKVAFLVNGEHVGSRNIVGGIRAGQPLNTTFTWIAQPGTNPAICIKADYSNIIPESDETNNDYVETLTLVIKSPDLVITQLTFEPAGSIHVGDTVKFTAKVENVGEGNYNGNFDIGFYVDDAYAGISHVIDGVSGGESIFGTFNWTASSCSNPVIKAEADFFDSVLESDEENNEKTETLPASIPYADLEIVSINWTPTENINDRDPVTFNVTVKNNGPENVVTDFKVYFDIDGYFTRTNVISGGLAAGESMTTSFTWKSTPGEGHNATANVDPDSIVPESNETNNEKIQLLPFNVSLVEIFEVRVKPAEMTTGIGGQTSCEIKINNYGSASGNFDINVSGLDSDWYTLSKTPVYLLAGQEDVIDLTISVPEACENNGTFPFEVSVTSQETGITRQGSANLIVEPTPVIHDLLPRDRASLGSDDVTFSWNTHINSSSTIYLKSEDETDYTSYTGAEGQFHTVVVSNLARNKDYSYYAESTSPCGAFNSSIRTFYIGNGICFTLEFVLPGMSMKLLWSGTTINV